MAGMFPTFVADPNDRNRRYHSTAGPTWPDSLRAAYYAVSYTHLTLPTKA